MKDELQLKLVEILTSIQTATGKAADFAVTQLPDIAQSYITYGRISTTVWALVFWVPTILLMRAIYKNRSDFTDGEPWAILAAFGVMVFGLIACGVTQDALLVWLSPKVWLLRELAQLVK